MSFKQFALAVFFSVVALGRESREGTYVMDNPVIVLTKNGTAVSGEALLRGPKGAIALEDKQWRVTTGEDANGIWHLAATLTALPTPSKQARELIVTSAGGKYPVTYWLVDAEPATAIVWASLTDGLIGRSQCLQISGSTNGPFPVAGVRMVAGRVRDELTGSIVLLKKGAFSRLDRNVVKEPGETIPPHSAQVFKVCGARWPLGGFTVNLVLVSLQEGKPQILTFGFRTRDGGGNAAVDEKPKYQLRNPVAILSPVTEAANNESKIFVGELIVMGPTGAATFSDLGEPPLASVQPLAATFFNKSDRGGLWKIPIRLAKVDKDAVQRRLLTITTPNGPPVSLEYWIVNSGVPITLATSHSTDQASLAPRECLPVTMAADRVPITGLRLEGGTIVESKMGNVLRTAQLRLVSDDNLFDIAPRSSRRFQIGPAGDWPAGMLAGKLRFSSDQKYFPEDLIIAFNTRMHEAWGLTLLVGGTLLCLILRFFGDAKVARAQAMVPVVELRNQYASLADRLSPIKNNLPSLKTDMEQQMKSLGDQALQSHLPSAITGGIQGLGDLPAYLEGPADRLAKLELLLRGGLLIPKCLPLPSAAKVAKAFEDLDKLTEEFKFLDLDPVHTRIQTILDSLATPDNEEANARGDKVQPVTFQTLEVAVRRWVYARLIIGAVLIVLSGAISLMLSQRSFGTPFDLALCGLWGFGLTSIAGAITRDQVLSSVGLPVPQRG